jgi:hypothetical protein
MGRRWGKAMEISTDTRWWLRYLEEIPGRDAAVKLVQREIKRDLVVKLF